jgi:hypothetical protein
MRAETRGPAAPLATNRRLSVSEAATWSTGPPQNARSVILMPAATARNTSAHSWREIIPAVEARAVTVGGRSACGRFVIAIHPTWKERVRRSVAEGSPGSYALTAKSCQVPGTPFSVCSP